MNRNCRSSITINQRMFKLIGVILIFCLALSQIRISPVRIAFAESSYDYGDAPAPYPVLEIAGAKHEATGPTLGSNRDSESDGMPSSNADGDDTDGAPDDEDGITFGTVQVGQLDASVTVNVQSAPSGAKLDAWIDFNQDGSWGGPGEQIFDSLSVIAGDNVLEFDVPTWALNGNTYARFRLSTAGDLGQGWAASDGEVEDHILTIISPESRNGVFGYQHTIYDNILGAESLVIVDLDGDGDQDVLTAAFDNDTIAWQENDGSQNFTNHTITSSADGATSVFAIDIDGDGDMDVLSSSWHDDKIAWYENDGSQNFTAHVITSSTDMAESVSAADLDGDGDVDVLSASRNDNKVAWYENDGSQNFTLHIITTSAINACSVKTADLDGDGDLDVLAAESYEDKVTWYENDGAQNFTLHTITTSANATCSIAVADIDGDGDQDVASMNHSINVGGGVDIFWYENDGSQNFASYIVTEDVIRYARDISIGDVNGDGHMDFLSASSEDDKIVWYKNDGAETFSARVITSSADGAVSVRPADMDGDGDLDVISLSASDHEISWYEQYDVDPPSMGVKGNGILIPDGDDTPSLTDHSDFGTAAIGSETITRTFTIENTGEWELSLIDDPVYAIPYVQIDGYRFAVTSQPSSPVPGSGGTTTFEITFDPINQESVEAEVIIYSDDYTKHPYNFTIRGYGYDNDDIYDALEIPSVPFSFDQNVGGATLEGGEPDFVCAPGVASVWYKFTPTVSGFYDVDTSGSDYDTVVHVYENGGADPYACNDDYSESQSRSIFYGTAGTEYHIGVIKYEEPSSASVMDWSDKTKESNLFAALDGTGENLIFSLNSYSCPGDVICAMVFDMAGDPLTFPDMHVYTSGGTKVSYTNSVMGGYIESVSLPVDTYNVDLTGTQTFISETGWSLGYNSASAESLPLIQLHAKDIYGEENINGEVWLRNGDSIDWVGWFEDHSSLFISATPGTYDIYVQEWYYRDYALLKEDYVHSSGAIVTLDASTMPIDAVTFNWDGPTWGYAIIPIFDTYISYLGAIPSGYTIIVSNPDTSYTLGAEPILEDGSDVWYYSFYDCCPVIGSPFQTVSCMTGGTLTTDLRVVGDPFVEGGTGSLETTVEDAYGNLLGAIDLEDDDGILSMSFMGASDPPADKVYPGHRDLIDTRLAAITKTAMSSDFDRSLQGSVWFTLLPDYTVEDALSTPIPGGLAGSYFTAPYEFDIPHPANTGTWLGDVVIEFGPYQEDGIDSVAFEVIPPPFDKIGQYDPATSFFYLKPANETGWDGVNSFKFGPAGGGREPITGNWDGIEDDTIGLYDPVTSFFYLKPANETGWDGVNIFKWGPPGGGRIPIAGDWNGNGTDTVGHYDPVTSTFYLKPANETGWDGVNIFKWGPPGGGRIPIVGDWDDDGTDTVGLYDPVTSIFYLKPANETGWDGVLSFKFGPAGGGREPIAGDWDGDGTDTIGQYDPATSFFYLKPANETGWSGVNIFKFGPPGGGREPIAGNW